jgi:tRNA U34 2-thiouridine synthase MnmA/TrmU
MGADTGKKAIRCLHLFSGGLDSQLAVRVLQGQGIEVLALVFTSPFFGAGMALKAAGQLGLDLKTVDFTADIIGLVKNPPHGFGQGMNPCVDCHARMLRRAGDMMNELGCSFLSTGEVLNERPMSQNREMLAVVARDSGHGELIVRPLSARLLPETEPERRGWVDRNRLLGFQGRSRTAQFALARKYGLTDYPQPAGGCKLTEPNFVKRLRDLASHEGLDGVRMIELLKVGRHFRLPGGARLIVGRDEKDNTALEGRADRSDFILRVTSIPGPVALVIGDAGEVDVQTACGVCARYADVDGTVPVTVEMSGRGNGATQAMPASRETIEGIRI